MKKKYVVFFLLSLTANIYAQNSWFPLANGPKSFQFTGVCFINADTGFVAGYDIGNYRTTDGGTSWSFLDKVYGEKFKFFKNNKLGFCYGFGIYQTTDYGFTWAERNDIPLMDIEFPSDSIGYAVGLVGNNSSIQFGKTTDGGITWKYKNILPVPTNERIVDIYNLTFRNDKFGFVTETFEVPSCGGGGVSGYNTSDGGETWVESFSSHQILFLHDSTWLSTYNSGGGVDKTSNDFKTYRQVSLNRIPKATYCQAGYNLSMSDTNNISAMTPVPSIFRSTDAGETWYQQLCGGGPTSGSNGGISTPTKLVGYAVGIDSFIYKTIDGGGPPFTSDAKQVPSIHRDFTILSNPTTSSADFQFEALQSPETFELFDLLGRSLLRQQLSAGQASLHIDLAQYPPGIYFARLGGETVRFIKI